MSDVRMMVDLSCPREQAWLAVSDGRIISTWFMPTDLQPVSGGACRFFPAPATAGFPGPFDADILEVTAPQRIVMLWRGEHLHTNVIWELTGAPSGCRLEFIQSGFLGRDSEHRRRELLSSYGYFFQQRLVAVFPPALAPSLAPPVSRSPDRTWRLRLLSIAGAMVLTVLAATALATLSLPAAIELPAESEITSAWDQVSFERSGTWWIFTPLDAQRQLASGQEFTFYFQVGGDAKPTACSVDGVPCSGLI